MQIDLNTSSIGKSFKKIRFKWFYLSLLFIGLSLGLYAAAPSPISKPYTFSTGDPARAAEVNANFDAVYTKVNELDGRVSAWESSAVFEDYTETALGANIEMAAIVGGMFVMGSPDADDNKETNEQPQHPVKLSDFYIGKYEVTQDKWVAVMGSNPSFYNFCGGDCPVEQVSWNDVQLFITALNVASGKMYRLPTEAE